MGYCESPWLWIGTEWEYDHGTIMDYFENNMDYCESGHEINENLDELSELARNMGTSYSVSWSWMLNVGSQGVNFS